MGVPAQPLRVGVTVIVPTMFTPVLFKGAFHVVIFPVPPATRPILILEFAHAKVAPVGLLPKGPIVIGAPGQTAILEIAVTVGVG